VSGLWLVTFFLGAALQLWIIARMQRRSWRRYPLLFVYCIVLFLSSIVEVAAFLNILSGWSTGTDAYERYYWTCEAILQMLILGVMLSLLYRAMRGHSGRWVASLGLGGVATAYVLFSYLGAEEARRLTEAARNLSFASALLNLALWLALVRIGPLDRQLLLLSAGIGIQTTGKAIGHSLRYVSRDMVEAGNILIVAVHLLCLFIWWWAFSRGFEAARERTSTRGVESF